MISPHKYLIVFYFLAISGLAQNLEIKKLNSELKSAKHDTLKAIILNKIGDQLVETDPEQAIKNFQQALVLSIANNSTKRIGRTYTLLAQAYLRMGNAPMAVEYHKRALKVAKQLKNRSLMATCYTNLGTDYENMGNFSVAMDYALRAVKIFEGLNNLKGMADNYNNIGYSYYIQNNTELGTKYFNEALKLYITLKDSSLVANAYDNLGAANYKAKKYDESLKYSLMAVDMRKKIHDTIGIADPYINIALVYFAKKNYQPAIKYDLAALNVFSRIDDRAQMALVCANLASVYYEMYDYPNTILYLDKGFKYAKETGSFQVVLVSYQMFSKYYSDTKDYKKAFEFHKLWKELNDSLFNVEKNKQITEMQTKYESEKKEKEINQLTQKTQILSQQNKIQELDIRQKWYFIIGLLASAILILVIAFLLVGQNKLKAAQSKMEIEQKLFRSQMNPHFIFNSLIAIQNYVYKHEASEVAKYISNFAKLMRMILENSRNEYVTMEKELSTLKYYLELQQLRFPGKFDFTIDVDPNMDIESISIPPMLSQPFIENSIEHGLMNKSNGKGNISIKFMQKEKMIELQVEDNGIGRENAANLKNKQDIKHVSLATTITQERLALLNKKNKNKFSFTINDLKNADGSAKGTLVTILMPES